MGLFLDCFGKSKLWSAFQVLSHWHRLCACPVSDSHSRLVRPRIGSSQLYRSRGDIISCFLIVVPWNYANLGATCSFLQYSVKEASPCCCTFLQRATWNFYLQSIPATCLQWLWSVLAIWHFTCYQLTMVCEYWRPYCVLGPFPNAVATSDSRHMGIVQLQGALGSLSTNSSENVCNVPLYGVDFYSLRALPS